MLVATLCVSALVSTLCLSSIQFLFCPCAHAVARSSGVMAPPGAKWRPIAIKTQLTFTGGFQNKSYVMETTEVQVGDTQQVFVKFDKNAEWLVKACGGPTAQRGALKRTTIIEELKKKLVASGSDTNVADAVAVVTVDPMDLLDTLSEPTPKKRKYVKKRQSGLIQKVRMPMYARSAHPSSTEVYTATCFPRGANGLWVHQDDVEWLVRYVADDAAFGAVDVGMAALPDKLPNSSVSGLHMRWDFQHGSQWEALFVEGPLLGTRITSTVGSMTVEKWQTVSAAVAASSAAVAASSAAVAVSSPLVETIRLENATIAQRKQGTFLFLEMHCRKFLAAHGSVDAIVAG
jgi:hypothetical protein